MSFDNLISFYAQLQVVLSVFFMRKTNRESYLP